MDDFLQLIDKIIKWNGAALSISPPTVRVAEQCEFATPTVKSAVSTDGRGLLINRSFAESPQDEPFVWLVISHELRHVWQIANADMFAEYRTSADISLADYNSQPAEIDAWAWAVVVVEKLFALRPTLEHTLGENVWKLIQERAHQINTQF